MSPPRILVVGSGGVGGAVLAAIAAQASAAGGPPPVVLVRDEGHANALHLRGARVDGAGRGFGGPVQVVRRPEDLPPFDLALLCTQPPDVVAAAETVARAMAPGGAVVCLQNGLCEERVARSLGPEQVLGAIVSFGASLTRPGHATRTSKGGFTVGRLDGSVDDPRLALLVALLSPLGTARVTANLRGARWSKLAINVAISALGTIGGDRLGPLMRHTVVRRLCLHLMSETVAVGTAEGVRFEPISGTFDLLSLALTPGERQGARTLPLVAKHGALLLVGMKYRHLRSSMLAAIERGRPPAVDFLNGEIVERGVAWTLPTPVNAAARDAVWAISTGAQEAGLPAIDALAASVGLGG